MECSVRDDSPSACSLLYLTSRLLSYSGDTMPSENLVKAGANATVLIHEATMGDDQETMAYQKAHSTFSQAVAIGRRFVPLFSRGDYHC